MKCYRLLQIFSAFWVEIIQILSWQSSLSINNNFSLTILNLLRHFYLRNIIQIFFISRCVSLNFFLSRKILSLKYIFFVHDVWIIIEMHGGNSLIGDENGIVWLRHAYYAFHWWIMNNWKEQGFMQFLNLCIVLNFLW